MRRDYSGAILLTCIAFAAFFVFVIGSQPNLQPSDGSASFAEDVSGQGLSVFLSPTGVTVTWTDNANDETHFELERSTGASSFAFANIANVPSNTVPAPSSVNYLDTTASGQVFNWRVRACISNLCSAYSNTATLSVPESAPSNFAAVVSADDVSLSWTDNADNENGYVVERRIPGGVFAVVATLPANSVAHIDPNLANSEYEYRVKATNSFVGDSAYSSTINAIVNFNTAPNPPTGVNVNFA